MNSLERHVFQQKEAVFDIQQWVLEGLEADPPEPRSFDLQVKPSIFIDKEQHNRHRFGPLQRREDRYQGEQILSSIMWKPTEHSGNILLIPIVEFDDRTVEYRLRNSVRREAEIIRALSSTAGVDPDLLMPFGK